MSNFFSSENDLWKPLGYVADVVLLSGLWTVCSSPIVTAGAATTALYDCTARCVRGHDLDLLGRFFRTFKRELVPSAITSLLWFLILWGSFRLVKLYGNSVEVTRTTTLITVALLAAWSVLVGVFCWVLPLLSRFTFSLAGLNITAVKLALSHIIRTVAIGGVTVVCGWFCMKRVFPVLFVPELVALFWSLLMEPVFRQYMPPDLAETGADGEEE